jgi:hypothetical protein
MKDDGDDDDFIGSTSDDDEISMSSAELAVWLSDFMSQSQKAQRLYRSHFCNIVVNRLFDEFGVEGMCELMMAIDRRAGWISDILIEDTELHDALFNIHGIFDDDAIIKARMSKELIEMNRKIWRLRRKYAKLIAQEIVTGIDTSESNGNND